MIAVNVKYGDSSRQIYFPCQEGVLSRTLLELQVPEEKWVAPKLFVDEVVNCDELKGIEGDFIDLDELNYLAKRLESFDKKELMKFNAAVSISGMRTIPDLINLTFNEHYISEELGTILYDVLKTKLTPEHIQQEINRYIPETQLSDKTVRQLFKIYFYDVVLYHDQKPRVYIRFDEDIKRVIVLEFFRRIIGQYLRE